MPYAPTDTLSLRHRTVRRALASERLDALVVTVLPNVQYLTNFTGSAGIAIVSGEGIEFLTDSRYQAAVGSTRGTSHECPGMKVTIIDGSYDVTLSRVLGDRQFTRVGFEAHHLTVERFSWLEGALAKRPGAPELVATHGIIESARLRKDDYELHALRQGARLLATAAEQVFGEVAAGRSEREIGLAVDMHLRRAGFERLAFETIVASGPNSALPHARPTERRLVENDLLVLDFGGVYDSYCVDLTRTVSVGRATERARKVHAAVLAAHDRAISAVAPGATRFEVDRAAREVLEEAGMGDAFGHGTGHGLGLEVHEGPRIVRQRPDELAVAADQLVAGVVFTIEPGAYFPGWGGVRIEDDVAVTESGVEVLTRLTTELLEL
jgi:Xaa-Pro aminopeptidase